MSNVRRHMPSLPPTTAVAIALLAVVALGLCSLLRARRRITEQVVFAAEYRERLHVLMEQRDGQAYEWLTVNANRMQAQMGDGGLVTMRPPHATYMVSNYPVVLNGLAEIRKFFSDGYLSGTDLPAQYGALIDDALLRHHGTLIERHRINGASLKNPFTWVAVGTQKLLAAPLWLLASLGVVSQRLAARVAASSLFRMLSGIVATVAFLSAVVGLVTGWEQFIAITRKVVAGAF
jgi:hypothetical protein